MSHHTRSAPTSSRSSRQIALGAAATLALFLTPIAGASALPDAGSTGGRPVDAAEPRSATTYTADVQTDLFIGDEVQPSDFVATPDGRTGLVTTRTGATFHFVDLSTRTVDGSLTLPTAGAEAITLSPDGRLAYVILTDSTWSKGLAVVDIASRSVAATFPAPMQNIQELALSADGSVLFVLGLSGELAKLDTTSGDLLGSTTLPGTNFHSLALAAEGAELLAGGQQGLLTIDAADLTLLRTVKVPGFSDLGNLTYDASPERLYVSDTSGSRLGVLNPATGELISSAAVGSPMHDVVGSDTRDRAYGNVPYWDMLMSADLSTGVRSESYRATPTAPFSISMNPVTGDLLSANGGWSNAEKGSTVSIVLAPGVSDPEDVSATTVGDEVTFRTSVTGIKSARAGGTVQWQSSPDGTEWTDVEGATGDELTVTVDADSVALSYRVRWADSFWGAAGASAAAHIDVPGPKITLDTMPSGTVGTEYTETAITATGQEGLRWSVPTVTRAVGMPEGLSLDLETGVVSGTPETAGDYMLTVTVTDVFGTDTRDFPIMVTSDEPTDPPTTPTPTPTDPPTTPLTPTDPPTTTGPTTPPTVVSPTPEPTSTDAPATPTSPPVAGVGGAGATSSGDASTVDQLASTGSGLGAWAVFGALALVAAGVLATQVRRRV